MCKENTYSYNMMMFDRYGTNISLTLEGVFKVIHVEFLKKFFVFSRVATITCGPCSKLWTVPFSGEG